MGIETVLVTGSNGGIGRAVVDELARGGYRVVTFDREADHPSVAHRQWTGDLLDPARVQEAVAESDVEGIIHLGTLPHPEGRPGHVTYQSNAMTTYHVLEAAAMADVDRVCLASSINALGGVFQADPMEVEYLPVDEEHPLTPRDPYALGKRTIELQADGFSRRRSGPNAIATFRFPFVAGPEEMDEHFVDPVRTLDAIDDDSFATRDDLFAYVAKRDAARALRRGLEAEFDGHETFFAAAADTTVETPTPTLVEECYAGAVVPTVARLGGTQSLVDSGKARRILDWEPERSWRTRAGTAGRERDRSRGPVRTKPDGGRHRGASK